jgi:hypothetical protein
MWSFCGGELYCWTKNFFVNNSFNLCSCMIEIIVWVRNKFLVILKKTTSRPSVCFVMHMEKVAELHKALLQSDFQGML